MATPGRALPQPTPETQHFWDGARAGELLLQGCDDCGKVYFPPRPFCPACVSSSEMAITVLFLSVVEFSMAWTIKFIEASFSSMHVEYAWDEPQRLPGWSSSNEM